jgi:pimeloyl-ACP methyl ester carboxylesterase
MRNWSPVGWALLATVSLLGIVQAHPQESPLRIQFDGIDVAGTLLDPHGDEPVPLVLLVGGSQSQDRDGRMIREGAPPRDALKRWADAMMAGGYACFRYDPVGSGASRATIPWKGTYRQQAEVVQGLVRYFRRDGRYPQIVLLGESSGAYVICLAAKAGTIADATICLGALCGDSEEFYAYNYGRLRDYAAQSPEHEAWARRYARMDLAIGKHYPEFFAAARAGDDAYELEDDDFRVTLDLTRRKEELQWPAIDQFQYLRGPVLLLAGERDRHVPSEHAVRAAEQIRKAGNEQVTAQIIDGVDHHFQRAPGNERQQIEHRYSLQSLRQPYSSAAYWAALRWLDKHVPSPLEVRDTKVELAASRPIPVPAESRAVLEPELDPVTESTPRRLFLARGIEIISDITDRKETAGVDTLEGRIGPLILGQGSQAHFIDMPGGMYVEEQPHTSESMVYTVRGQWVLASNGRRQLMKPGSLFRFAANAPTGYEVPFRDSAFILIFKGDRLTKVESDFIQFLQSMADRRAREHEQGDPCLLRELPPDHAARKFAREVNPRFEEELARDGR